MNISEKINIDLSLDEVALIINMSEERMQYYKMCIAHKEVFTEDELAQRLKESGIINKIMKKIYDQTNDLDENK